MSFASYIDIAVAVLFIVMVVFFQNNVDATPQDILPKIVNIEEQLFNITESGEYMSYTSLYDNKPTVKNSIGNIIHGMVDSIFIWFNTMLPLATYLAAGYYASLFIKLLVLYVCLRLLFVLPLLIKTTIAIWFFIQEKKRLKEKWYH